MCGGRAEIKIDAVDLVAGGAAEHQSEIADHLVGTDALENEGGALVEAARLALEARAPARPSPSP